MTISRSPRTAVDTSIELAIVSVGTSRLTVGELAAARQQITGKFSASLKPQFLKHSDPQTLAAVEALTAATDDFEPRLCVPTSDNFADWAIVSATQYLGRSAFAAVIEKYQIDGPWGVSVQVIPHTSPHAVASTLSLALASHGPCIGVGAAPGEETQALLTTATLLERSEIPGTWLVLSGWSPEPPIDVEGTETIEAQCRAGVMAVVSSHSPVAESAIGRISFRTCGTGERAEAANLLTWLTDTSYDRKPTHSAVSGDVRVTIEWFTAPSQPADTDPAVMVAPIAFGKSRPLAVAASSHL